MQKTNIPGEKTSLATWLAYLKSLHKKNIDMGLSRVSLVAERLNVLNPAPFIFTVAGTNGKGTTCCTLEAILMAEGYRVGVYSSPHLMRYTERVRVQNIELSELNHILSFSKIEAARGNISLTYFEYSTVSALLLFKKAQLDVLVLEVGLGGRLDATNIVDADVAIITSIGLDHTDWLGLDRESIGYEKAGIFRPKKPAVIGEPDMPYTIAQVAKEKDSYLLRRGIDWGYLVKDDSWHFFDAFGVLNDLPLPKVPQPNAATAIAAIRASGLQVREQAIREGIHNAILQGRFQVIRESPKVILDVAHNSHAAAHLVERLECLQKTGRVLVLIGILNDKDIRNFLVCMDSVVDYWYCASLEGPRGASSKQLLEHLCQRKAKAYSSVKKAWEAIITDARLQDIVVVCGSFYTVANVIDAINHRKNSDEKV